MKIRNDNGDKQKIILKEENDKRTNEIKKLIKQLRVTCLTEKSIY